MNTSRLCFTWLGLIPGSALGQMPDASRDFVLLEKDAVAMLGPEVVAGTTVEQASWSPDGKYVLAVRRASSVGSNELATLLKNPKDADSSNLFEDSLVSWASESRKSTPLIKLGGAQGRVEEVQWIPGGSNAIVQIMVATPSTTGKNPEVSEQFAFVSCASGAVKLLATLGSTANVEEWGGISISPTKAIAVVFIESARGADSPGSEPQSSFDVRVVGADGTIASTVTFPSKPHTFFEVEWDVSGDGPYIAKTVVALGKATVTREKLDVATGRTVPAGDVKMFQSRRGFTPTASAEGSQAQAQDRTDPASPPILTVADGNGVAMLKPSAVDLKSLWLCSSFTSEFPTAEVCADATGGALSPTGDGILYISQGVAMVRPLVHVSKDLFLKAKAAAERAARLSQAKQVGLAILMYSADNDDKYPGKNDNLHDILGPYLKNDSLLQNFVYTFAGGLATDVSSPATTEVGYVPGPGGRAVTYADGHAKWLSN